MGKQELQLKTSIKYISIGKVVFWVHYDKMEKTIYQNNQFSVLRNMFIYFVLAASTNVQRVHTNSPVICQTFFYQPSQAVIVQFVWNEPVNH